MRYDESDRESKNVEDRRGEGGGFGFPGGRGIRIPIGGGGGLSLTSLLIIGALMLFMGINPLDVLLGGGQGQINMPQLPRAERPVQADRAPAGQPGAATGPTTCATAASDPKTFISCVLADTEEVWGQTFRAAGRTYEEPKLVIFTDFTRTACGAGQAQMGPFYCPLDRKVYIDLGFFEEMKRKFNIDGDFAPAYVVAHEVGHHVQTLLGIAERVQQMKSQASDEAEANQIQVRMELQADCLAGVWANVTDQMKNRLEPGDIEEGMNAATQIGDDMIQRKMTGRVVPDAFTHGSSAQRVRWFRAGFDTGRTDSCDTFNAARL